MAGLVGVFVLILVWTLGYQVELTNHLNQQASAHQQEQQRRIALEQALAEPLARGRITLNNGRIDISGSVLFDVNSAQLQAEGHAVLQSLIVPCKFTWTNATNC